MSDKSSDIEDWAFVDNDGEVESSDDASSSSMEVVNVDNDVVTYRRSVERSVSSENSTQKSENPNEITDASDLVTDDADAGSDLLVEQVTNSFNSENKDDSSCPEIDPSADTRASGAQCSNEDDLVTESNISSASSTEPDNITESLSQELAPIDCSTQSVSAEEDLKRVCRESLPSTSGASANQPLSLGDNSDNSSEADSDFIRLEGADSLDVDNQSDGAGMTSSSVSSRFSFLSRENSPAQDMEDDAVQPQPVILPPVPLGVAVLNDLNIPPGGDHAGNHGNASDMEDNNQSAEVEEDQDLTESGTEDERIESDQSDTGSIPPLDDDMSFVNDIGDLPLIAGDVARQYVHNPNRHLNLILDVIAILMFTVVVGLGIGHAIATFDEIEEYESLHSSLVSLRSRFMTCQNQRWSQRQSIKDLKIDQAEQDTIMDKYLNSRKEIERLLIRNSELTAQLNSFQKDYATEESEIRINLQNQINQLKTEKEDLKKLIGQLKYTIHPANDHSGTPSDDTGVSVKAEACDKSAATLNLDTTKHRARMSDCSLDDLAAIHESESLDNIKLKQQVGKLRYTRHPGNLAESSDNSKESQPLKTQRKLPTLDLEVELIENITQLKEELNLAQKNTEIWHQRYLEEKKQNEINSTVCLTYLLKNLNDTIISSLDSQILEKLYATSASIADDVKSSMTKLSNNFLLNLAKSGDEIMKEFSGANEEDNIQNEDPESVHSSKTEHLKDYDDLEDESGVYEEDIFSVEDDTDVSLDKSTATLDATKYRHTSSESDASMEDESDASMEDESDDSMEDARDASLDENEGNNNSLDMKSENIDYIEDMTLDNDNNETLDSDSENSNETEDKPPYQKWSHNVKDILNKTRDKMSNVTKQIQDTWLQVKNLSHQFWSQHEPDVTKTLSRISSKVSKFGKRITEKIKHKVSKWYKKARELKQKTQKAKTKKSKKDFSSKSTSRKFSSKKNIKIIIKKKFHKKNNKNKATKHQNNDQHENNVLRDLKEDQHNKNNKAIRKDQKELLHKLRKFNHLIFEKNNSTTFNSMTAKDHSRILDICHSFKHIAADCELLKPNEKKHKLLVFLDCQDLWWSSVVVKDMLTDPQIITCSKSLADWQMGKLLRRRRNLISNEKRAVDERKSVLKKIIKLEKKYSYLDKDVDADWQFERADYRERVRHVESESDWLFKRAQHRKDVRDTESQSNWMFDRAHVREEQRHSHNERRQRHPAKVISNSLFDAFDEYYWYD